MMLRVTVVALPAKSVATIVTKFDPSTSATEPVNAPLGSSAIGAPLAVTVTECTSVVDPRTCTVSNRVTNPELGAATESVGACVSRVTVLVESAPLPAASTATM